VFVVVVVVVVDFVMTQSGNFWIHPRVLSPSKWLFPRGMSPEVFTNFLFPAHVHYAVS